MAAGGKEFFLKNEKWWEQKYYSGGVECQGVVYLIKVAPDGEGKELGKSRGNEGK